MPRSLLFFFLHYLHRLYFRSKYLIFIGLVGVGLWVFEHPEIKLLLI